MNNYKINRLNRLTNSTNLKIDKTISIKDLDQKALEVLKKTPGAFIIGKKIIGDKK